MKKNSLEDFIKKIIKEYTGTGAGGGNAGDGNNITSPRPFPDDMSEIENYVLKNVYGAEGGQWVGDPVSSTFTRHPHVKFEGLKEYIREILKELEEQAYGSATLTTQGQQAGRGIGVWQEDEEEPIKEQVTAAAQKSYEAGLKRLQKSVLRYQVRWIEKQRSAAISQAAQAGQEAGKGFDEQIKALMDQIRAIDNPEQAKQGGGGGGEPQNESLLEKYINERKNIDLMRYMDSYKRGILLEGTVRKLFRRFNKGESNEDITRKYAKKGIQIPEQFLSKVRKQYESLKKLKLEIDFAEQESKDVITVPTKSQDIQLFDLEPEEEEKELSSRLYKEEEEKEEKESKNKISIDTDEVEVFDDVDKVDSVTINLKEAETKKRYPIPPEIEHLLTNTLKMNPLIRFVSGLKAVNSIPPSYRVFLHNGQFFDVYYEEYSLKIKIGIDEYWEGEQTDVNYAIKHINRLLTSPKMRAGDNEEEDLEGIAPMDAPPSPGPGAPPSPPPSPEPPDEPADEPEEEA